MAGKNEVTLTFAGDEQKLTQSFDKVGAAAKGMSSDVGEAGKGFDRAGEAADNLDTKSMGFRDTMTGVQDSMRGTSMIAKGDLFNGFFTLGMGVGDLGSGLYNFLIPSLKAVSSGMVSTARTAVVSSARQAGAWAALSAKALANAARIAAAWVISMGPIALVVAAVIGLTIVVVRNWTRIRSFITGAASAVLGFLRRNWPLILGILTGPVGLAVLAIARNKDRIIGLFRAIPSAVRGIFAGLGQMIVAPISAAIGGIRSAWNSTLGGKGFTAPSWVPGIGGKGFHIPYLHAGGRVPGPPGADVLAVLQAGETVSPAGGGGGRAVLEIRSGGSRLDDALLELLARAIRRRAGGAPNSVQLVLGGAA